MRIKKLISLVLTVCMLLALVQFPVVADTGTAPVYGDTTNEGDIDGRDVILLCQHLANFDFETNTSTVIVGEGADANGDGTVDGRDAIILCQYLANFDFETGSSTIVLGPQGQGGEPSDEPDEPGDEPDEPGDEPEADGKLELLTDDITINRIFDSGWVGDAIFSNPENLLDGDTATYSEWDQYKDDGETADCCAEFIIDLGTVRNISKVSVFTGVPGFGSDSWSNASPMNAEIKVSANRMDWTSVYTYDSDTVEATRVDEVELDPEGNGAGVRYVMYTFNKVARRATISEIEIYAEVSAGDSDDEPDEPGDEPDEPGEEPEQPALPYYDIDAAATAQGISTSKNSVLPASIFVELGTTYGGYKIDGKYKVDADTLRMLATVPCTGSGTIAYKDYNNFTDYIGNKSYGEGCGPHSYGEQIKNAPVSKLSDPLYMSMVLPSEGPTYQNVLYPNDPRNNGNNMHKPCNVSGCNQCAKVDYTRLNTLGAVYMNQDKKDELENYKDVQFKICLGNIRLLVKTANGGWQQVKLDATPSSGNGSLYCLPWQYEWNSATSDTYLANCKSLSKVSRKNGYSEITVSVSDFFFSKTFKGTDGKDYTLDERLLHFWGSQYRFSNDADILGIIASYDMWIEYDESIGIKLEDYFISSIGADWRLSNGSTKQSFAGYKHAVSTEKTTVFGHNIGPSDYDTLVTANDLETIKGLLGIQ